MKQIKSLLRNFKARTVSFFKAPYLQLHSSLWNTIHDEAICLVENKLDINRLRGVFITSSDMDDELNDCKTISDIDYEINKLQDEKLNSDDFDYELCQAYSFTELSDKVDELEANSDGDPFTDIDDENHPVSKLIDDRTDQIHDLIIAVMQKVDEPSEPNIKYLVSELQKAVQDKADISVFKYLVDSLANKVADNG
jgi:hypothetical protein